jgi:hypothetical protein
MGHKFNQPISRSILPTNLTHLILGYDFNQPITSLPDSLESLTIGHNYKHPICSDINNLPVNLKHLNINSSYEFINDIPEQIEQLAININNYNIINNFPAGLKKLIVNVENYGKYIKKIPFGCEVVIDY